MPRLARKDINTQFLHVMVKGVNKEYIFEKDSNKRAYLSLMKEYNSLFRFWLKFTKIGYIIIRKGSEYTKMYKFVPLTFFKKFLIWRICQKFKEDNYMKLKKHEYRKFKKGEYSIRDDDVFKIVFGANERSNYLKELLESLLHKKITNIVIRNDVALDKIHADNKLMRLDILAEIDGKEMVNIEFQNKNEYNVEERSDAYASGIYYNSLKVGDKYIQAKKQ